EGPGFVSAAWKQRPEACCAAANLAPRCSKSRHPEKRAHRVVVVYCARTENPCPTRGLLARSRTRRGRHHVQGIASSEPGRLFAAPRPTGAPHGQVRG